MNRVFVLTATLALAWGPSSVRFLHAGVIVYTDKAVFSAAALGLTTIDFNGIAPENWLVRYTPAVLTLSGVEFEANGRMYVIDPGFYGFSYAGAGFLHVDKTSILSVTLPAGATAIGTDYGGLFAGGGTTFSVALSTGDVFDFSTDKSIEGGSLDFLGFTSTVPISSLTFNNMPDEPAFNAIDNFVFGSAVPEPSTITLWSVFGVISGILAWRRRTSPGSHSKGFRPIKAARRQRQLPRLHAAESPDVPPSPTCTTRTA